MIIDADRTTLSAGDTTTLGELPVVDHATRRRSVTVPRLAAGEYLAIEDGGEVVVIALVDDVTHLGRAFSAQIRLEATTVSRRHAIVVRDQEDGSVAILDDRSQNGITVNGERVERAVLQDGDRIDVGAVRLTFLRR